MWSMAMRGGLRSYVLVFAATVARACARDSERVLPGLAKQGKAKKVGKGWHPAG